MGRRKIEIQPITNERNRAVTFLKRKQGLFKKAYELGVLCSVDVAVIIFERRQGSEKLFQYSSGDAQAIIKKQARFEGERNLQGPADFNGSAPGSKGGAGGDDDEDDEGDVEPDELATQPVAPTPSSSAPATSSASAAAKSKGKTKATAPASAAASTVVKKEPPTAAEEAHPPPSPSVSTSPSPPSAPHRASTLSAPRDSDRHARSRDKDRDAGPSRARSRSPPRGSHPSKRQRLSPPPSGYPFRMDLDLSSLPPPMSLGLGMSLPPYYHPHHGHPPSHRSYPPPPPSHYPPYTYPPDTYRLPRISHPPSGGSSRRRTADEILADCWNGTATPAELASLLEPPEPTDPLSFEWPVSAPQNYPPGGGTRGAHSDDAAGWLEMLGGLDPPMRASSAAATRAGGLKRNRAEDPDED